MTLFPGPSPVPVKDAAAIGKRHGYDQIIIIARKCGSGGCESVTSWGIDEAHHEAASTAANFLKDKVMRWANVRVQCDLAATNPGDRNHKEKEEDGRT
jgi:hypothetical protein